MFHEAIVLELHAKELYFSFDESYVVRSGESNVRIILSKTIGLCFFRGIHFSCFLLRTVKLESSQVFRGGRSTFRK